MHELAAAVEAGGVGPGEGKADRKRAASQAPKDR